MPPKEASLLFYSNPRNFLLIYLDFDIIVLGQRLALPNKQPIEKCADKQGADIVVRSFFYTPLRPFLLAVMNDVNLLIISISVN